MNKTGVQLEMQQENCVAFIVARVVNSYFESPVEIVRVGIQLEIADCKRVLCMYACRYLMALVSGIVDLIGSRRRLPRGTEHVCSRLYSLATLRLQSPYDLKSAHSAC